MTEAVWRIAKHRYVYIQQLPERAGHAMDLLFVDGLEESVRDIGSRGIEPAAQETYDNGVGKLTYRDADGNEVSFGAASE